MKVKIILSTLALFLTLSCQTGLNTKPEMASEAVKLQLNPKIETGKLENGVTYFIQENAKPENRIELRLIVNTGSIQEDESQLGLAHFVEHMAFNGTKNFEKDKLVKYLESLGMGFGPEINAYTSFDETVYQLSIPADDPEIISNAFLILEDWAHQISFDDEEIEKERGVVVEEWRTGRGVQGRYQDILLPTLLKDSRYADRLPIGDMEVIKNCDPQELRDYYNEWYRPELIAIAVVGNITDVDVKSEIEKHFNFKNEYNGRARVSYDTPIIERTAIEIISDPEMTYSDISMFMKKPLIRILTESDYRNYITEVLGILIFNSRMEEIYKKPDSPFMYAGTGTTSFVRDLAMSMFSAQVKEGEISTGFKALLVEIEKVRQNGFNQDELDRAKSLITMILNQMYNERENVESINIIRELVSHYLEGNVVMDIADETTLLNSFIEEITLEEVNMGGKTFFNGVDKTITVHVPENKDIVLPTKEELLSLFDTVAEESYEKREEESATKPLFNKDLTPGIVTNQEVDEENGITTVTLDNGAVILLKPTDFMDDEIQFSAISYGGLSLVEDNEFLSGSIAASLVKMSGLNGMDSIELDRALTGKNVSVSPWIGNYTEGFSGGSNILDQEIMFQVIHLYFTNPEFSDESYEVLINNITDYIANRENSPKTIFNDRVKELLSSGHFRSKPFDMDSLSEVSLKEIEEVYMERFSDPSDFYYVFTGNFSVHEIIPMLTTYIGSIPAKNLKETPKDLGITFPKGVIEESVIKGLEEQSVVEIVFNGDFVGTEEDEFALNMLSNYLEEELRVLIREQMSGTYGVSVFSDIRLYPVRKYMFGIYFGCEPGREEELSEAVFSELEKLKSGDVDEDALNAVLANFSRNMELNLKDNNYWLQNIVNAALLDRDFEDIQDTDTSDITAEKFIALANSYINSDQFVKVILKPE